MNFANIYREDKTLRSYQQKAKQKIFASWDECDNVMFQMPTGTGKTRLFTSIISDIKAWNIINSIDAKILIIAHRVELIEQISDSLNKYNIPHGLIAGGKDRDLRQSVQVASIQTITHHTNTGFAQGMNIQFIIIDEAHHSMANSYKKLWSMFPSSKKLGVTATPWRMNNGGFKSIYDIIILSKQIKDFIKDGWLSKYSYYSIKSDSYIEKNINSIDEFDIEGDYKTSALESRMDTLKIRAQLLDSYLKYAKGKKGIIYSISRSHSEHICEEYRAQGINIVIIDSKTSRDERRLYVQRFKKGLIDIIVNVDIFSEGFDCPDIEFIQLARPTKSLVKYLQQVGRGLRPTIGKSNCLILDNVGLNYVFGLPNADRDWMESFEGDTIPQKRKKNSNNVNIEIDKPNISYEEGNEEMCLIDGDDVLNQWNEKDETLLKTLYFERNCSINILVEVFKKSESEIIKKIEELNNKIDKPE